ncbi:hypothetical protein MUN88_14415 [Gracilibacillus caseinilyticus]|uniref:Uncharacterized protein n=1 Tax=Gracilibacillus caseinilyticus TaxID=2932256 RepID=A0ABY4ES44_9BACI|nr:hypothetical protein [Gracilibacillus caseinilyticus]UOQ47258.1 hypothetical protein MUN88_14415 [Gracilibacillus caseinilyticus]
MELLKEKINSGDEIAKNIYEIYTSTYGESQSDMVTINSATDFGKCVVGKFADSYGSIARGILTGAIFTYL